MAISKKTTCIPAPLQDSALGAAIAITNRHKGRSNVIALLAIVNNYLAIAACAVICEHVFVDVYPVSNTTWWTIYAFFALVIASRLRAFENFVHEASHNNLFIKPRAHEWLEFLYAFPVFRLLKDYRTQHLEHHKYLGDPARDADAVRMVYLGFIRPDVDGYRLNSSKFNWLMFGLPLTGWLHYEYLVTTFAEYWTSSASYPSKALYWAGVMSYVHMCNHWRLFALYYVVPWFCILTVTRYWAEIGEHIGQDMRNDWGNSRTNDGFWHQWWIHPINDGLHSVHHLNSQVPFHRLRKAHDDLVQESSEFRERTTVSNGVLETFSQIYRNPTYVKEASGGRDEWDSGQVWASLK
ncbi:hypothetical protein VKT23_006663 [Stygiomarasmius scandens]|uniref:Fatty acid desaturase domain-containing protein n=1 Tax=Marasmiellus scandens TaxID=2682957 RepID=A0ABR1JP25_9AGAR